MKSWIAEKIEHWPIDRLVPYARNPRTHSEAQIAQIAASIAEFGFTNPILVGNDGVVVAGHGRLAAAQKLGLETVPVVVLDHLTPTQRRALMIADNRITENAGWDYNALQFEIEELQNEFDLDLMGFSEEDLDRLLNGLNSSKSENIETFGGETLPLRERFIFPPFSVLNARDKLWQDRKMRWLALGIKSELGRGSGLLMKSLTSHPSFYEQKTKKEAELGRKISTAEFIEKYYEKPEDAYSSGNSIFDPVLCELVYRWFCPPGGVVLDPFAGGSVRGIVAAKLGLRYFGVELRREQIEANIEQLYIVGDDEPTPVWLCGDSRNIDSICNGLEADLLFSCPPYVDLEEYSDDPRDLSTMNYSNFREAYFDIIKRACSLLKNNRFAVFVVGEVRDKRSAHGAYYNFVGDTVQAFRDAGLIYYNEAILVTVVGSTAVRVGKQFTTSRKLGKTHQNVLVFCKGDPKLATEACGDVEVDLDLEKRGGVGEL